MFNSHLIIFTILCKCAFAKDPSILIIGAGPAGISAAARLLANAFTHVKVLEAEDRIGGRINSVRFGAKFVDLGAEYCHGQGDNVVYNLVAHLDLLAPIAPHFHVHLYYSNGSRLEETFTEELQAAVLGYDSDNEEYNATGRSIGEVFSRKYNASVLARHKDDDGCSKIFKEAIKLAEQVSLMIDGAFSWVDTSAVKHYRRSAGHQLLVWKGRGYRTILDVLMGKFPPHNRTLPIDGRIFLNKQVSGISWNEDDHVVVTTSDNSSYSADHVIFTPSVGVLKDVKDTLFHPPLPSHKMEAIEAIGIAGVMKIIMHFKSEWWRKEDVIFSFLWSDEELHKSATEFPGGPVDGDISWITAITVMAKVPGNPNVLVAWVTGAMVPEIENTDLDVLKEGCAFVIEKFLGKAYNVSAPSDALKSTWRSNAHFRGTYSYERAGFDRNDILYQEKLAEPLEDDRGRPVVLFAGEATNPIHYSTVHGAIETGFREADRIINLYKDN